MKLFIDVDNTILEHSHFYSKSTEGRTHKAIADNIEFNKEAIKFMYDSSIVPYPKSIKNLWSENDVYILTKYPSLEFDKFKQKKLSDVLGITVEDLNLATDNEGNKKYINVPMKDSKVEHIKKTFAVQDVSGYVLIDDYSENIVEWEEQGGIGIKFYNEYNSPLHPNIGLAVSDFKIFDMFFAKKKAKKIFLKYQKSFSLEHEVNELFDSKDIKEKIDIDYEIFKECLNNLNIDQSIIKKDYDYLNLIKEYCLLIDAAYPDYWHIFWNKFLKNNDGILFKSSYSIKVKEILEEQKDNTEYLSAIIIENKENSKTHYDLYISIEHDKHYIEGHNQFEKLKKILSQVLG